MHDLSLPYVHRQTRYGRSSFLFQWQCLMTFQVGDPFWALAEGGGQCGSGTLGNIHTLLNFSPFFVVRVKSPSFILQRDEQDH